MEATFAIIYAISMGIVVLFQGCLAAGVPWGAASMGGKYPGKYPYKMRVVAMVNMIVLSVLSIVVLIRAKLMLPQFYEISRFAIWLVIGFAAISVVLNTITKSKIERIWIPVTLIQLITSIVVAVS